MKFKITFILVIWVLAVTISDCKQAHDNPDREDNNGDWNNSYYSEASEEPTFPDFSMLFRESSEYPVFYNPEDEVFYTDDAIAYFLLQDCIRTNYIPWDNDHQSFVNYVSKKCQTYYGEKSLEKILDYLNQTINCTTNNIKTPRQSIRTQFIASVQCMKDKLTDSQLYQQVLIQKKKSSTKSQHQLKKKGA
ncbi:hypothetical protein ABPG74_013627 [Tetrahymena malaccensis]